MKADFYQGVPDCMPGEVPFERDRRLFINSFPDKKLFKIEYPNGDIMKFEVNTNYENIPIKWELRLESLNTMKALITMRVNTPRKIKGVVCTTKIKPHKPASIILRHGLKEYTSIWFIDSLPVQGLKQIQEGISNVVEARFPEYVSIPGFLNERKSFIKLVHISTERFSFKELTEMFPPKRR